MDVFNNVFKGDARVVSAETGRLDVLMFNRLFTAMYEQCRYDDKTEFFQIVREAFDDHIKYVVKLCSKANRISKKIRETKDKRERKRLAVAAHKQSFKAHSALAEMNFYVMANCVRILGEDRKRVPITKQELIEANEWRKRNFIYCGYLEMAKDGMWHVRQPTAEEVERNMKIVEKSNNFKTVFEREKTLFDFCE